MCERERERVLLLLWRSHFVTPDDHLDHLCAGETTFREHLERARDLLDAWREGAQPTAGPDIRCRDPHCVPRLRQVKDGTVH